jgi:TolB protein
MRRAAASFLVLAALAAPVTAQEQDRAQDAIRIGITYRPGTRPGLVVLPGAGLDSVRAILRRDLDYSDRFQMIDAGSGGGSGAVNYNYYRTQFNADHAVELVSAPGGVSVRLHDLAAGRVRNQQVFALPAQTAGDFRLAVHRISDEVTRWASGTDGYAASRLLILSGDRIYQVDSDGAGLAPVTPAGEKALSNVWAPDGRRIAYTRFSAGRGTIVLRDLAGGAATVAHGTDADLNFSPAFSPDGRTLAFARAEETGATNIFTSNVASSCCLQRLTVRNFADNLSPTYSPDGRRIAYVSSRAGPPQIYVMSADGTDQEVLASFDYGATGPSFAPEWSPDGASVVFHREVSRSPQIFILDVASGRVKQLTSVGRNEDATWAPDGRHVAFISDRTGRRQVWVVDTETGRVRQISTAGSARLPSWSRRLGGSAGSNP